VDYVLVIHPAEEGGYWAEVPALEGCFVQGESVEELLSEAPNAIASHVQALEDDGQRAPRENGIIIATVRMAETAKV
jgi:predicted RNase H-like HicB family nuclease